MKTTTIGYQDSIDLTQALTRLDIKLNRLITITNRGYINDQQSPFPTQQATAVQQKD